MDNKDAGAMILRVMRKAEERGIINTDQQIDLLMLFLKEIEW